MNQFGSAVHCKLACEVMHTVTSLNCGSCRTPGRLSQQRSASTPLRPHVCADQWQFGLAGLQSQLQQAEKDRAELLQICHGKLAGIPGA